MKITDAFAVPGEDSIIDCINPDTGNSCINGETLEQIRLRYPKAEVVSMETFCAQKAARQDIPIEWDEVTEDKYHEMLNVLPPEEWRQGAFLVGEPWDHHAVSGQPRFQGFRHTGDKYYASSRPMTRKEFKSIA